MRGIVIAAGVIAAPLIAIGGAWWALERGFLNGLIEAQVGRDFEFDLHSAPDLDWEYGQLLVRLASLGVADRFGRWAAEIDELSVGLRWRDWVAGEFVVHELGVGSGMVRVLADTDGDQSRQPISDHSDVQGWGLGEPLVRHVRLSDVTVETFDGGALARLDQFDAHWISEFDIDVAGDGQFAGLPFSIASRETGPDGERDAIAIEVTLADSTAQADIDPVDQRLELNAALSGKLSAQLNKAGLDLPVLPGLDVEATLTSHPSHDQISATLATGETQLSLDGRLSDGAQFHGRMQAEGPNPGPLLDQMDFPAIDTPPFRLEATVDAGVDQIAFSDLSGTVGDSTIAGSIRVAANQTPTAIEARLSSTELDFDDLFPLVGLPPETGEGETASADQAAHQRELEDGGPLLPQGEIDPADWQGFDVDVQFSAEQVRSTYLPIDRLEVSLVGRQGWLTIDPMTIGLADGRIVGFGSFDTTQQPPAAELDLRLSRFHLGAALDKLGIDGRAYGEVHGRIQLAGVGYSLAELARQANGVIAVVMSDGKIEAIVLEAVGLDAMEAIAVLVADGAKDGFVPVRCAVANLKVERGRAHADPIVVDTTDTKLTAKGWVDLADETLDLLIEAHPKDVSLLSGNQPIQVEGAWRSPSIAPAPGGVENNALGWLLAPIAAVLPIVDLGEAEDAPCRGLIEEARRAAEQKSD